MENNQKMEEIFKSKAFVLKYLRNNLKKSKIEKGFDFTVNEWKKNENEIFRKISNECSSSKLIIRSSAIGEDSFSNSQAGNYESVLNVNPKSEKSIKDAINLVIKSYENKGNENLDNQILIQNQTQGIQISGVIFTKSGNKSAPYYVINYEEGDSTVGVTSGQSSKTVKIFRKIKQSKIPEIWKPLIISLKEIEKITDESILDIEFAITKNNKVIIFQVRPITVQKNNIKNLDIKIGQKIEKIKKQFSLQIKNSHQNIVFSDMTDWNPAEILGINPNILDYTIYDFLIMNYAWHKGRTDIGYQEGFPKNLMVKFGNKPYINVEASFSSLLPKMFSLKLKKKLLKFYFCKLKESPHLHDKVEFEILFTCYDFTLKERLKELKRNGFTKNEIQTIEKNLIKFTNKILEQFPEILNKSTHAIKKMDSNRMNILKNVKKKSYSSSLSAAKKLLQDCKNLGTINFSAMARIAFVSSILLKSLVKKQEIKQKTYDDFMNSISTIVSEFQDDLQKYEKRILSEKDVLKKYGHLRPGTYDITSKRYDQQIDILKGISFSRKIRSGLSKNKKSEILKILKKYPLIFNEINFLNFVEESLKQREELKFEFSHNLSDALELIGNAGKVLGFNKEEIANVKIQTLLNHKKYTKKQFQDKLRREINIQQKEKFYNSFLELPSIIFSNLDFDIVPYYTSKPNFITTKKIDAQLINLSNNKKQILELNNKIVLIENADPGYDWIFTKNPSGLITKYGGVASHMAIRCAELGLPAAIGCGEILFDYLSSANSVSLDCKSEQIFILKTENVDEFLEEKKALKSLGYIK